MTRKKTFAVSSFLTTALTIFQSQALAQLSHPALFKNPNEYQRYIHHYEKPEFFSHNEEALRARLKLLDQVPSGGKAKIMTFVYDNGESTRLLAMHMCLAAKRGVQVEFLPDSKTGDRPKIRDAFDGNPHHQLNEEAYQMLANCGVQVKVHNHISGFKTSYLSGATIPSLPDTAISAIVHDWVSNYAGRALDVKRFVTDFTSLVDGHFAINSRRFKAEDLKRLRSIMKTLVLGALFAYWSGDDQEDRVAKIGAALDSARDELEQSGALTSLDPAQVKITLHELLEKVKGHPNLGEFYRQARVFNRLNHRKLFWVSHDNQSCMMLGGRNLGDHYLTWGRHGDEFMDGDVLICGHHLGERDENVLAQAEASFDELWWNKDLEDPIGVRPRLTEIKADPKFKFAMLRFPDFSHPYWGNPMWIVTPQDPATKNWLVPDTDQSRVSAYKDLSVNDRQLPAPLEWKDDAKIGGIEIEGAYHWRVATSTWNRQKDKVRSELYRAIERERELIYIETAYSEFSTEFKSRIEGALQRGVRVRLITNSIFVSDGGSKVIRLVMARWTRQMQERYPELFSIQFATIEHGHMIHFKGAAFRCQQDGGRLYRLNLIGSHNFHARSGYSDKEHALIWEQDPSAECRDRVGIAGPVGSSPDLMDIRDDFYKALSAKAAPLKPLKTFATFEQELYDGIKSGKLTKKRAMTAKWALQFLYRFAGERNGEMIFERDEQGHALLRKHDEFIKVLEILSESGFSDLIGTLL